MRGLSPVAESGGHSSPRCTGLSLSWPLPLQSTGSRRADSVVVAHGPSRSAACGIFPDRGSNPCPLHWQADSQPLHHQGSPKVSLFGERWCQPFSLLCVLGNYPSRFCFHEHLRMLWGGGMTGPSRVTCRWEMPSSEPRPSFKGKTGGGNPAFSLES